MSHCNRFEYWSGRHSFFKIKIQGDEGRLERVNGGERETYVILSTVLKNKYKNSPWLNGSIDLEYQPLHQKVVGLTLVRHIYRLRFNPVGAPKVGNWFMFLSLPPSLKNQ